MSKATELLLENDPKRQLTQLHDKYLSLDKQIKELKNYTNRMLKSSKHEFESFHAELTYSKLNIEKDIQSIESLLSKLKGVQIVKDTHSNRKKMLKTINDRLPDKKAELNQVLAEINEYEKRFDSEKTSSLEKSGYSSKSGDSIRNHLLTYLEYKPTRYLNEREQTFKQMKTVSEKTVELSNTLRAEVVKQGSNIDQIEDKIKIGKENVIKGGLQIKLADDVGQKRKIRLYIIFFALIALIGLIAILVKDFIL